MAYCEWRTDRVNEKRLCEELGIKFEKYKTDFKDTEETFFSTERYLKDPDYLLEQFKTKKKSKDRNKSAWELGKNPKKNVSAREDRKGKIGKNEFWVFEFYRAFCGHIRVK